MEYSLDQGQLLASSALHRILKKCVQNMQLHKSALCDVINDYVLLIVLMVNLKD